VYLKFLETFYKSQVRLIPTNLTLDLVSLGPFWTELTQAHIGIS